ncbi:transcriptional regulator [Microlunatus endophyticus]|uniref:Transcriptional regulator n=1 Tax=Microlunatus endophyticus TaxID=1716077 RepID=A0A917SJA3_9ACTN|nr:GAF domain-containing protein [Microlunatus endophyticus]GGL82452.1 transcriptional regulator [Microlunatus endophyticus]
MRRDGALDPGAGDGRTDLRLLASAHDAFVSDGSVDPVVRPMVLDSWRRSLTGGADPETMVAPFVIDAAGLAELRDQHPLGPVMPVIRQLLVEEAELAGMLVAVSDAAGRLLWVEGNHAMRSRAERMNFVEGTSWRETDAGTNAPGTALALDREVQIFRAEHLARTVTPWSCTAAPIHDPDTGSLVGVLDLTGGDPVAGPTSLALVRATVRAVESELRINRLTRPPGSDRNGSRPALEVLGRHQAEWRSGARQTRLGLRHSEILVLLAESTDGMTADELEAALSVQPIATVTVRAELSRLRQAILPYRITTRPYRLDVRPDSDLERLRAAVAGHDHRRAVELYRGPLLPHSESPAIIDLREQLHHGVRRLLLEAGDPDSLLRFADTDFARPDLQLWQAAESLLPDGSPRRSEVLRRIRALLGDDA